MKLESRDLKVLMETIWLCGFLWRVGFLSMMSLIFLQERLSLLSRPMDLKATFLVGSCSSVR